MATMQRVVLTAHNRDPRLTGLHNLQDPGRGGETLTRSLALVILVSIHPRLASPLALLRPMLLAVAQRDARAKMAALRTRRRAWPSPPRRLAPLALLIVSPMALVLLVVPMAMASPVSVPNLMLILGRGSVVVLRMKLLRAVGRLVPGRALGLLAVLGRVMLPMLARVPVTMPPTAMPHLLGKRTAALTTLRRMPLRRSDRARGRVR